MAIERTKQKRHEEPLVSGPGHPCTALYCVSVYRASTTVPDVIQHMAMHGPWPWAGLAGGSSPAVVPGPRWPPGLLPRTMRRRDASKQTRACKPCAASWALSWPLATAMHGPCVDGPYRDRVPRLLVVEGIFYSL